MLRSKFFVVLMSLWAGSAYAALNVVATVPDLAAIAKAVGGQHVSVVSMSSETQDPHFVDARPNLAVQLNKADLLLLVGLQLEIGWLPTLLTGARNGKIQNGSKGYLDCSQFVHLLDVPKQAVDRSMGDVHPGGNPHYLTDPRAGSEVAKGIAQRLGELDPANAAEFQANAKALDNALQTSRQKWEQQMAPFKGTPFIGYHRTWVYIADWLGLVPVESIEPKPGIPPNPTHVVDVLNVAKVKKVPLILQETFYPTSASAIISEKTGATLLRLPGGTKFQAGQSYVDHLDELITGLQKALASKKQKEG